MLELFPKQNRKQRVKKIESELSFTTNILSIKLWMGYTIAIEFISSLIMLIFDWKYAFSGLIFSMFFCWITIQFFSTELEAITVGQLAEKLSREKYKKVRRHTSTVNRNEIVQKVKELFIKYFDMNELVLTRESTFV